MEFCKCKKVSKSFPKCYNSPTWTCQLGIKWRVAGRSVCIECLIFKLNSPLILAPPHPLPHPFSKYLPLSYRQIPPPSNSVCIPLSLFLLPQCLSSPMILPLSPHQTIILLGLLLRPVPSNQLAAVSRFQTHRDNSHFQFFNLIFPHSSRYISLTFRYISLTFRYISLTFRYISLSFRYISLTFRYISFTFRYISLTFRYLSLTFRYISLTFRYISLTFSYIH